MKWVCCSKTVLPALSAGHFRLVSSSLLCAVYVLVSSALLVFVLFAVLLLPIGFIVPVAFLTDLGSIMVDLLGLVMHHVFRWNKRYFGRGWFGHILQNAAVRTDMLPLSMTLVTEV